MRNHRALLNPQSEIFNLKSLWLRIQRVRALFVELLL